MKTRDYDMPAEEFTRLLEQESKLHARHRWVRALGGLITLVALSAVLRAVDTTYGMATALIFLFAMAIHLYADEKFGSWAQERLWSDAFLQKKRQSLEVDPAAEEAAETD